MKKIAITVMVLLGVLYLLVISYTAVFYQKSNGEPSWVEWKNERELDM